MKRYKILVPVILIAIITIISCKTVGRLAAKYWLDREINEFLSKCEDKASVLVGSEKAHKYCDCAVDKVAEQYHNYQDAKRISVMELIDFVNRCK
jgi:hypothetical protein